MIGLDKGVQNKETGKDIEKGRLIKHRNRLKEQATVEGR